MRPSHSASNPQPQVGCDQTLAGRLRRAIVETAEGLAQRKALGYGAPEHAATPSRWLIELKSICAAHLAAIEARRATDRKAA
jgi:hypothetical protein